MQILDRLAQRPQHAENPAGSFGFVFRWRLLNPERHAGNIGVRLDPRDGHVVLDYRAATTNAFLGVLY